MAQHDYNLANQSGADFRADLNNALSAIVTVNSGATSPSTTFAHQLWVDTANSVLKIRNSANDAWITTGVSITADNTFDINGGTVNGITSFSFSTGSTVTSILDEDDLSSDSATALATQQSIKAYVDSQVATVDTLAEILLNGNSTGGTDISLSSSDITGTGNINITGTIQSSGTITGNLTGDVTGNASTATALETARTINGTSFDGTANISFDTDSVSEGSSNLYYTNARVESYLDAGTSTPTFASAVINSSLTGSAVLDDDTFATASATTVATSESIKAYVDSQVGSVDTLAEILLNGNTTGGTDIAFGDNDKAIFGTGSDLQIYHDSSSNHSIIAESGAGSLFIRGQSITMQNADGSKAYFGGNGDVATAYYGTSAKLATSSSGIDVTGTVTADGVGLAAGSTISSAGGLLVTIDDNNNTSSTYFEINADGTSKSIARFVENGDISFYDDTGTTQGLFWDASAESLGIGTTSPSATLHVDGDALIKKNIFSSGDSVLKIQNGGNTGNLIDAQVWNGSAFETSFVATQSGNVGIGTSSPSTTLELSNAFTAPKLRLSNENNSVAAGGDLGVIEFYSGDNSNSGDSVQASLSVIQPTTDNVSGEFVFKTSNAVENSGALTERVRIAKDGSVGIGTDSPSAALDVGGQHLLQDNYDATGAVFRRNGTYGSVISLGRQGVGDGATLDYPADNTLAFSLNGSEKARIDSSGNLLVGTTDLNGNPAGICLRSTGLIVGTVASGTVGYFNRTTSDGTILDFRKDGTAVGSIATKYDDLLIYSTASGHKGLRFAGGEILPVSNAGALEDNTTDLGSSGSRFQDLYLSGGVYLGGTGAANKLDDYEEGTWTPALGGTWTTNPTSLSGNYTKIGRMVYILMKMTGGVKTNQITGYITGLPFATNNSFGGTGSVTNASVVDYGNCLFQNTDRIWLTASNFGTGTVYIAGVYETTA